MTHPTKARAFAGATVGNVICGFDILGLALDNSDHSLGDTVEVSSRPDTGVIIKSVHSIDSGIPTDPSKNVAGVAAMAVLERSEEPETGLEIEIWKGLPLSGGMGGSSLHPHPPRGQNNARSGVACGHLWPRHRRTESGVRNRPFRLAASPNSGPCGNCGIRYQPPAAW